MSAYNIELLVASTAACEFDFVILPVGVSLSM